MKIHNPFRLGLLAGLGVLVAILIGTAVGQLALILTYVGAALFLALGIDPVVSWLERHGWKRWLAILVTLLGIVGVFVGLVFAIVPVITEQVNKLIGQAPDLIEFFTSGAAYEWAESTFPWIPIDTVVAEVTKWTQDADNITGIFGGVLQTAVTIASGAFGALIILILTLYFVTSLSSIKRSLYQLVPASKRERVIDISEQVSTAVGRYVVGQGALGLCNGVLSFIFFSIIGAEYPALFAFIAFLFSLVPLVGTITGSIVIVAIQWLVNPDSFITVLTTAIYYLVYMQVEAYVLSPNIMNRAVKVPGVIVVIAALAGGTLGGILGALVAIPVAASILIIVKQVFIPKQQTL
ncbi:AI-2E family transporter [Salinibacterium sp. ZJ454]|uniref:AI-2E family transporter n=1 Tax=Salinibacterium sp. ZJ454 TaxID=2708339 RepID=UPI001423266D|nr:AI-2E family transporter [Salinibacterium sp. ZJ454]